MPLVGRRNPAAGIERLQPSDVILPLLIGLKLKKPWNTRPSDSCLVMMMKHLECSTLPHRHES